MSRRSWWVDASLAAGFAALTALLAAGWLLNVDVAIRNWCEANRVGAVYWTARVLNFLGNGTPMAIITLGLALLVARRARSLRPLLVPILTFGLTTAVTYVFKFGVDRAAPRSPLPHAVELGSGGESYPAGHLVVAIVWYGAIVALLDRLVVLPRWLRIVIRVAPPIIVTATTIYVRFHWLTDDLAGIMLGALLDRLLGRLPSGLPPPRSAG